MGSFVDKEKAKVKDRANYRCNRCSFEWNNNPGWQGDFDIGCPKCGNLFLTWLNYKELFPCLPIK